MGVLYSLSISNCPKEMPQTRKYNDSYKLLIGKCPEINHLKISCKAIKIFTKTVNVLTSEDDFLLKTDIKEIGKLINKKQKTNKPIAETGSYIKFSRKLSNIIFRNLA